MLKQLLKNKLNFLFLIGLYLVNILWVWAFPQIASMMEEFSTDSAILTIKPFYLGVIVITMGNTFLAYYLSKNYSSKLWVSNLVIVTQDIAMIYILYSDIFQTSCITE